MIRRILPAQLAELGPRQVRVRASTGNLGRDGLIVHPQGIEIDHFRANPVMLWQHDAATPVARATTIGIDGGDLCADVDFAPEGVSPKADEVCGLVKAGIVNAVSIGFESLDEELVDKTRPRGPRRVTRSELLEILFVSVPADREAIVLQRAETTDGEGDDNKPKDGEDEHKPGEQKPGDGEGSGAEDEERKRQEEESRRQAGTHRVRGMFGIASLAWLMEALGEEVTRSRMEAALEGDASGIPEMLLGCLRSLGDTLIAMTSEEVEELIAEKGEADEDDLAGLGEDEIAAITQAKTVPLRRFRVHYFHVKHATTRAGRVLSAASQQCLRDALATHEEAMDQHRAAMRTHRAAATAINELMDRADILPGDSKTTQTSAGVDENEGSRSVDYRRRQAELLALLPA